MILDESNTEKMMGSLLLLMLTSVLVFSRELAEVFIVSDSIFAHFGFRFLSLLCAVAVVASWWGWGRLLAYALDLQPHSKSFIWNYLTILVGLTIQGVFVYLLGFTQLLDGSLLKVFSLIGVLALLIFLVKSNRVEWQTLSLGSYRNYPVSAGLTFIFLMGRLLASLSHLSFGDPLFYNLPAGRDYLLAGGFQWFSHAELYSQIGLFDLALVGLQAWTVNSHLIQLSAQAIYSLMGTISLFLIAHTYLFQTAPLWWRTALSLAVTALGIFHLEATVAKPDYLIAVVYILIIALMKEKADFAERETPADTLQWVLFLSCLCVAMKATSLFFLGPLVLCFLVWKLKEIPFRQLSFWLFLVCCACLFLLNFFKNFFIFENPFFPFKNEIFHSNYWYPFESEALRTSFRLNSGDASEFPERILGVVLASLPCVAFAVIGFLSCCAKEGLPRVRIKVQKMTWFLLSVWALNTVIWILFFPPHIFPRFMIGYVYLTAILWIFVGLDVWKTVRFTEKSQRYFALFILVVAFGETRTDVDLQHGLRFLFKEGSYYQQWSTLNPESRVQAYFNQHFSADEVFLSPRAKRFHTNAKILPYRPFSPRTGVFFSGKDEEILAAISKNEIDYVAVKKDSLDQKSAGIERSLFLEEAFVLHGSTEEYLVFQVPK
jgi:hypothetical protein